jgi:hypothetical protein
MRNNTEKRLDGVCHPFDLYFGIKMKPRLHGYDMDFIWTL